MKELFKCLFGIKSPSIVVDDTKNLLLLDRIGISCEQMANNVHQLNKAIKIMIESYLTEEEIKELNNPKTKKRRIKKLINISNQRMLLEVKYNENTRW